MFESETVMDMLCEMISWNPGPCFLLGILMHIKKLCGIRNHSSFVLLTNL